MKSICSIFAAKAFFSLLIAAGVGVSFASEENYSLWPKRPEAFLKARELAKNGDVDGSIKELTPFIKEDGIIGKEAKAMLGELRIRQVLSPDACDPENYVVKRGDSWIRIAQRTKCPLDYIMHVNQLTELGPLQVGQGIKVKTLDYRIEIDVPQKEISLWDGKAFIKAYGIVSVNDQSRSNVETTIKAKAAGINSMPVSIYSPDYASADKSVTLTQGNLVIASGQPSKPGFYLKRDDCNELALLLRPGNAVNIIRQK